MTKIVDINDFSNGSIDNSNPQEPKWEGTGVFDIIMKAANENIKIQNQTSRITGAEYAEVYLGTMQTAISEAMRFLLNKDQSTKDLEVKQANIDLLNRQREGFDDNKYQKLFEAQMNAWALMFSSGLLTTQPSIISNDSASSLYNVLKPK
jgi:3-methyladenine DNA glycosylase/8-oxoguanine DNA glycosylase